MGHCGGTNYFQARSRPVRQKDIDACRNSTSTTMAAPAERGTTAQVAARATPALASAAATTVATTVATSAAMGCVAVGGTAQATGAACGAARDRAGCEEPGNAGCMWNPAGGESVAVAPLNAAVTKSSTADLDDNGGDGGDGGGDGQLGAVIGSILGAGVLICIVAAGIYYYVNVAAAATVPNTPPPLYASKNVVKVHFHVQLGHGPSNT